LKGWHERFQQLVNVLAKIDGRRSSNGLPTPIGPEQETPFEPTFADQKSQSCSGEKVFLPAGTGMLPDNIAFADKTRMLPN
jgi:hypothetical protein